MKLAADWVIRAAVPGDGPAVVAVYAPYVRDTAVSFELEPPPASVMAQRIGETVATHPWLVAEESGRVAGFAYAGWHSQRPGYRWTVDVTVYVAMERQRGGVGRGLYGALLATLRAQGFRSAFAEIVLPNAGSVRLHEAFGFVGIGTHRDVGFKLGRWRDIGYWRLGLSDGGEAPGEPLAFAAFRDTAAFAAIRGGTG